MESFIFLFFFFCSCSLLCLCCPNSECSRLFSVFRNASSPPGSWNHVLKVAAPLVLLLLPCSPGAQVALEPPSGASSSLCVSEGWWDTCPASQGHLDFNEKFFNLLLDFVWDLFGFSNIYLSTLMSANSGVSPGVILVSYCLLSSSV